LEYIDLIK